MCSPVNDIFSAISSSDNPDNSLGCDFEISTKPTILFVLNPCVDSRPISVPDSSGCI